MNVSQLRIKIDEDLPNRVVGVFAAAGYVCHGVRDQGWTGLSDEILWPRVQAARELFITADKGFGNIRKYPPGTHCGIVLLRCGRPSNVLYVNLCQKLLKQMKLENIESGLVVVTETLIRKVPAA